MNKTARTRIGFLTVCAIIALGAAILPLGSTAETGITPSLDEVFLSANLWSLDRNGFMAESAKIRFKWGSTAKDSARAVMAGTFMGCRVVEAVVRFGSNTISDVLMSFYNRGDVGDISEEAFEQSATTIDTQIRAYAGRPAKEFYPPGNNSANRKFKTVIWTNSATVFRLEYAFTRVKKDAGRRTVQPEFINLTLMQKARQSAREMVGDTTVDVSAAAIRRRVKKTGNGDALIDSVPMVDQGQKGYCAVAATERVLRYYGTDVNQHELAQRAQTETHGGTDSRSIIRALKAMANAMNVRIKIVMQETGPDFEQLLSDYNREAKRRKKPEITLPNTQVIYVDDLLNSMDRGIFLKVRQKNNAAIERFTKQVKDQTGAGRPVLWGVTLGFVQEVPALPQASGGHLRLIIGCNATTKEVLYTDSWGPGHELKRMSSANAYAISTCLVVIEPR